MDTKTPSRTRKYTRRSDDQKIADLERRIADIKAKQMAKEKMANPVFKEIPKIQRRLRKFVQLAIDHNRPDIANSTMAFNAGLERMLRSETRSTVVEAEGEDEDTE